MCRRTLPHGINILSINISQTVQHTTTPGHLWMRVRSVISCAVCPVMTAHRAGDDHCAHREASKRRGMAVMMSAVVVTATTPCNEDSQRAHVVGQSCPGMAECSLPPPRPPPPIPSSAQQCRPSPRPFLRRRFYTTAFGQGVRCTAVGWSVWLEPVPTGRRANWALLGAPMEAIPLSAKKKRLVLVKEFTGLADTLAPLLEEDETWEAVIVEDFKVMSMMKMLHG
jgi:hypothetical protein